MEIFEHGTRQSDNKGIVIVQRQNTTKSIEGQIIHDDTLQIIWAK